MTPAPPDFHRWNNSAHEIYYPRSTGVDKYAMSRMWYLFVITNLNLSLSDIIIYYYNQALYICMRTKQCCWITVLLVILGGGNLSLNLKSHEIPPHVLSLEILIMESHSWFHYLPCCKRRAPDLSPPLSPPRIPPWSNTAINVLFVASKLLDYCL